MSTISTLRLDTGLNRNWNTDANPVAILNESSTLHERVAFCWGVARDIEQLVGLFVTGESTDLARACSLFLNQLEPLVAMLEHMGSSTHRSEELTGGKA